MVILGFTAIGTAGLTALIGWMRRQAAEAMDDGTPTLEDPSQSDYTSRLKSAFIKSSKTNVLYYFAFGEAILGVILLVIGWVASMA